MKKNLFIMLLGLLLVLIVSCENSQVPTSGVITTPTSREGDGDGTTNGSLLVRIPAEKV